MKNLETLGIDTDTSSQSDVVEEKAVEMDRGIKIDKIFYCLDTGKEKYIFATMDEAIDVLKSIDKKEIDTENAQILEVNTSGTTWKLTQVPWSKIAFKLI